VSLIDVSAARPLGQSSPLTAFWRKDASEKPHAFVLQEELDSIVRDLDAQPRVPMAVRRAAIVAARDAKARVTPRSSTFAGSAYYGPRHSSMNPLSV